MLANCKDSAEGNERYYRACKTDTSDISEQGAKSGLDRGKMYEDEFSISKISLMTLFGR